jgi:hypothetical protein
MAALALPEVCAKQPKAERERRSKRHGPHEAGHEYLMMTKPYCLDYAKFLFTKSQLTIFHHDSTNFGRALR